MKCKYCGKELVEGAKFCVYCGKPVEGETNIHIVEEPKEEIIPDPTEVNVAPENDIKIDEAPIESNVEVNVEPTPIELPKEEPEPIVEPEPVPQPTIENKTEVIVKKNNPILLLIIILLLVGILGVGGFYVYKNYIEKDNKNTGNTEPMETTDVKENNTGSESTKVTDVEEDNISSNSSSINLDEINIRINEYDEFLAKTFWRNKGENLISGELKFNLINLTVPNSKTYDNGTVQSFPYVTYDEYKTQYEKLYGDSSKMDQEIKDLNKKDTVNAENQYLGKGYISWNGTWSPVPYRNFKLTAKKAKNKTNGYIVYGTYICDETGEEKQPSGDFKIEYSKQNDKDVLVSIIILN